jgi:hypothetical protein
LGNNLANDATKEWEKAASTKIPEQLETASQEFPALEQRPLKKPAN